MYCTVHTFALSDLENAGLTGPEGHFYNFVDSSAKAWFTVVAGINTTPNVF